MPTQSTSDIRIPKWFVGLGKWAIGGLISAGFILFVAAIPWAANVSSKLEDISEVRVEIKDHVQDEDQHPSLDRISTQIENLDRMITRRSKSVDGKLDKIDSRIQRQWEAISEIRKRGP